MNEWRLFNYFCVQDAIILLRIIVCVVLKSTNILSQTFLLNQGGRLHSVGLARSGVVSQERDGLLGSGGPIVQRGVPQMRSQDRNQVSGRIGRIGRTTEQYQPIRGAKV